eukprot:gene30701-35731_t
MAAHDHACAWASANRRLIAHRFLSAIGSDPSPAKGTPFIDICHNSVVPKDGWASGSTENPEGSTRRLWLHRKGAAPIDSGPVVIPGSRGAFSYLVAPTDQYDKLKASAYSVAHGAGRKWSRSHALGVGQARYKNHRSLNTTDLGSQVEAPDAYKEIESIVGDLVDAGVVKRQTDARATKTAAPGPQTRLPEDQPTPSSHTTPAQCHTDAPGRPNLAPDRPKRRPRNPNRLPRGSPTDGPEVPNPTPAANQTTPACNNTDAPGTQTDAREDPNRRPSKPNRTASDRNLRRDDPNRARATKPTPPQQNRRPGYPNLTPEEPKPTSRKSKTDALRNQTDCARNQPTPGGPKRRPKTKPTPRNQTSRSPNRAILPKPTPRRPKTEAAQPNRARATKTDSPKTQTYAPQPNPTPATKPYSRATKPTSRVNQTDAP